MSKCCFFSRQFETGVPEGSLPSLHTQTCLESRYPAAVAALTYSLFAASQAQKISNLRRLKEHAYSYAYQKTS